MPLDVCWERVAWGYRHTSPNDPQWKGADSLVLEQVVALVKDRGWEVVNVDSVVIAERPNPGPSRPCAPLLRTKDCAGSGGGQSHHHQTPGPEGREEGISGHAVALLSKP